MNHIKGGNFKKSDLRILREVKTIFCYDKIQCFLEFNDDLLFV